jgi:hypothetical protein
LLSADTQDEWLTRVNVGEASEEAINCLKVLQGTETSLRLVRRRRKRRREDGEAATKSMFKKERWKIAELRFDCCTTCYKGLEVSRHEKA